MKEICFEKIDSTSSYIKRSYQILDDYTFVAASYQSEGKGRNQRKWDSNNNENLLFSLLIKDKEIISKYMHLSAISAVAIYNSLIDLDVKNVSIKWPNDVYVNDKKICGILLEGISENNELKAIVNGIGLNVNQVSFEEYRLFNATSIAKEKNKLFDLIKVKELVYENLLEEIIKIKENDNAYFNIVRNNNYLKDKEVYAYYDNQRIKVKVIDINDDFSLKVLYHNKEINISSGEITFHNLDNEAY